jgi:HAMP domain-containing protein
MISNLQTALLHFLKARIGVYKYMTWTRQPDIDGVQEEVPQVEAAARSTWGEQAASSDAQKRDQLLVSLQDYRDGVRKLTAETVQRDRSVDEAAKIREEMLETAQKVRASLESDRQLVDRNVQDAFSSATKVAVSGGGLALALGIICALLLSRSISRPLGAMTGAMGRLANGETSIDVPALGRGDEVGAMARAVEVFKQNAVENLRLTEASAKEQATRDRRQAAMDSHTQDFGTSASGVMASLGQSASKMNTAAEEMSEAAKRTRESTSGAVTSVDASARAQFRRGRRGTDVGQHR